MAFCSRLGERQRLAAGFVSYILPRAKEVGEDVYKNALEIINEGRSWGSLRLECLDGRVELNGRIYVAKVTGWGAEIEESRHCRKLLRIIITAEVGRVEGEHTIVDRAMREYTITFGRYREDNETSGFAYARTDAPGGRCQDVNRRGEGPNGRGAGVYCVESGKRIRIERHEERLKGFGRFAELAVTIMKWLMETSRRRLDIEIDATAQDSLRRLSAVLNYV